MNEEQQWEPWIETFTGKKFTFLKPNPDDIDIVDIGHSLGMQCRYTGHTVGFYSVAEHSVIVSLLVPEELALEGLLHDASEAYLADIAGPLKPHIKGYKEIEDTVMNVIAEKYGFQWPVRPEVKEADLLSLKTEAKYLLQSEGKDWADQIDAKGRVGKVPKCLNPYEAKFLFLNRFKEIVNDDVPRIVVPTVH